MRTADIYDRIDSVAARTAYVLGFVLTPECKKVLLTKKLRGPAFNIGKWNGIGGKIEAGEDARTAMCRESFEETGLSIDPEHWKYLGAHEGRDFSLSVFSTMVDGPLPIPKANDVGEPLAWKWVSDFVLPRSRHFSAQNVSTYLAFASAGSGVFSISDDA